MDQPFLLVSILSSRSPFPIEIVDIHFHKVYFLLLYSELCLCVIYYVLLNCSLIASASVGTFLLSSKTVSSYFAPYV